MKRVRVKLDNRVAYLKPPYPYDDLIKHWSYSVPNFRFVSRYTHGWDGRIKILKRDRLPAGLFRATRDEVAKDANVKFKVKARRKQIRFHKKTILSSTGKYEFQNSCRDAMVEAAQYGGGLIVNATGSGKTRIAAMFFAQMHGAGLFIVDQLDLLEQAQRDIAQHMGEKVGYVGNSKFRPERITVATRQTLAAHRHDSRFRKWTQTIDAMFIDEIHAQMNRSNFDIVEAIQPPVVFGLTATIQLRQKPVRLRAYSLAGPVIFEYPLVKGMQEGVLARGTIIRIVYPNTLTEKKSHAGRAANQQYDSRIVLNNERNSIISRLVRYGWKKGRYIVVLVQRVEHLRQLSNRLRDVPHKVVSGTFKGSHIDVSERRKSQKKFEKGKIRVIIANQVFKKGVDIKRLDMVIDAAAMRSKNDAIQKFGRGIRSHEEKEGLLYFDIADEDKHPQEVPIKDKEGQFVHDKDGEVKYKKKYHRFHEAAKDRKNAYKAAGIQVQDFRWEKDGETKEAYRAAERQLRNTLRHSQKTSNEKKDKRR